MSYLNPSLDTADLSAVFAARSRVLIRDFFLPHVADSLHDAAAAVDWSLSFRRAGKDDLITGPELRAQSPAERGALLNEVTEFATRGFQFSFLTHSLVATALQGEDDLLSRFVRWMGQQVFLGWMRELTGIANLDRVYAQATLYAPGNFLLIHNDAVPDEDRRLAYVINLTRGWRPDWGGLLHFCDEDGNIVDTFFPHYNSLSLFRVPQDHFVSYVAPYARAERMAITGWLISN